MRGAAPPGNRLTGSRRRGYGSPPPVRALSSRSTVLALALAASGCHESSRAIAPPQDRFFFPTGVAVQPAASAPGGRALLVISSNVDLAYSQSDGATLLSVDPRAASLGGALRPAPSSQVPFAPFASPGARLGIVQGPSFGGPLALATPAECPALGVAGPEGPARGPLALFASRYSDELVQVAVGDGGGLACGDRCRATLSPPGTDPFAVAVACADLTDPLPGAPRRNAYVGHQRSNAAGEISEVDLVTGKETRVIRVGAGVYGLVYDPDTDRLWTTAQVAAANALLDVVKLGTGCDPNDPVTIGLPCPRVEVAIDVFPTLRGAELRGVALSNPQAGLGRRAYVAAAVYDADLAVRIGGRPSFDVAAALVVLDLYDTAAGNPAARIVRIVPLALGADQLAVLPARAPHGDGSATRDLVAVVSTTEGVLTLYDDDEGAVAKVFALSPGPTDPATESGMAAGMPQMGRQPFGVAAEQRADGLGCGGLPLASGTGPVDCVYVTSFLSNVVQVVELDPAAPAAARIAGTLGEVAP